MRYHGSCHCGSIRLEVTGDLVSVMDCNCSICRRTAFLHWVVENDQVELHDPNKRLVSYVWGTGAARHYFCSTCGVSPLRRPRMKPDGYSVNVRCLEGVDLASLEVEACDGQALDLPDR